MKKYLIALVTIAIMFASCNLFHDTKNSNKDKIDPMPLPVLNDWPIDKGPGIPTEDKK